MEWRGCRSSDRFDRSTLVAALLSTRGHAATPSQSQAQQGEEREEAAVALVAHHRARR